MKKALIILFLSSVAYGGALDSLCFVLEGIPLPFCHFTRYHTCNSGFKERCMYRDQRITIKKIDDPQLGKCAAADLVCTTDCTSGPDGTHCSYNCKCNSPPGVITQCRTQCNKCYDPGPVIDLGIECPKFCGQPGHCATYYSGKEIVGPEVALCTTPQLCGPGSVDMGGPKNISECNLAPPADVPADYTGCCYAGGDNVGGNIMGLPSCN